MKFINAEMAGNIPNPTRWISMDSRYVIQQFTFAPGRKGRYRYKDLVRVKPYYRAYLKHDGSRLQVERARNTFDQAAEICFQHINGEKS